jgi:hypothetical protein
MNPATILAMIQLAQQLFTGGTAAYAAIKADLDASTVAQIEAAIASSGAALDAARKQLDADAA